MLHAGECNAVCPLPFILSSLWWIWYAVIFHVVMDIFVMRYCGPDVRCQHRHRRRGQGVTCSPQKIPKNFFRAIIIENLGIFRQTSCKIPKFCWLFRQISKIRAFDNVLAKNDVKFGHCVNFSDIFFGQQFLPPPLPLKLTELLRLWLPEPFSFYSQHLSSDLCAVTDNMRSANFSSNFFILLGLCLPFVLVWIPKSSTMWLLFNNLR